jgi:hypothetical protein
MTVTYTGLVEKPSLIEDKNNFVDNTVGFLSFYYNLK